MTLRALRETLVDDLCVLICVEHDLRVAAMDLKGLAIPVQLAAGEERTFTVRIESLPLIERDYSIGVFIRSSTDHLDSYGLASFEVVAPRRESTGTVYNPRDRGLVELAYAAAG
jgi:hypothetical protein